IYDAVKVGDLRADELFPHIALNSLGTVSALFFIIGLISAAFPSADGALTALTASFCIDFLGFNRKENFRTEEQKVKTRKRVHLSFACLLLITILVLNAATDRSVIDNILFFATITYGPLLGLFAFGILTKRQVNNKAAVIISIVIPAICFIVGLISRLDKANVFLGGYKFGNELLIINGGLIYLGLLFFSTKERKLA
ncbi:MAG TPA: sodium:solute symporter, partial [Bacteroidia bacterium]|nr:sodium:solute symporter [Bacteroidia bacterium]